MGACDDERAGTRSAAEGAGWELPRGSLAGCLRGRPVGEGCRTGSYPRRCTPSGPRGRPGCRRRQAKGRGREGCGRRVGELLLWRATTQSVHSRARARKTADRSFRSGRAAPREVQSTTLSVGTRLTTRERKRRRARIIISAGRRSGRLVRVLPSASLGGSVRSRACSGRQHESKHVLGGHPGTPGRLRAPASRATGLARPRSFCESGALPPSDEGELLWILH